MLENFSSFNDKDLSADKNICQQLMSMSGQIFRQVKSRITMRVELQNQFYFIKKYYPLTLREIIKNLVSLKWPFATAIHEYNAITAVKFLEIPTLDVVAYGSRKALIQSNSFLITKAIEPNINLDAFAEQLVLTKNYFKFKRWMIEFIANATRKLHLNGLNHRDYYLCHYLLNLDEAQIKSLVASFDRDVFATTKKTLCSKLFLIDLHRMQIRTKVPNKFIIKDLSAMLFSVRNLKLTQTDHLRFIKIYMNLASKSASKKFILREKNFLCSIINKSAAITEKG